MEKVVRGVREPRAEEVGESFWRVTGYGTWDWDSFKGHNNSSDRPVTVGHPKGRLFKGTHGRGTLELPADWPQADAVGAGLRCCWYSPGKGLDLQRARLADRLYAAVVDPSRCEHHRWRGVRTVPKEAAP